MPLSPPQRITLIRELRSRLANEDWSMLGVIFEQFSMGTDDTWEGGTLDSYVLNVIRNSPDDKLIELAKYLGYDLGASESPNAIHLPVLPLFWQPNLLRLFVSHLATHRDFAGALQQALLRYGISSFVAHNDIEPTSEWQRGIESALATCDALIALLHENFHLSLWTDQEIGFAMGRQVPAFAVKFGEAPYGFIARFQAFNGKNKAVGELARELFDAFRKHRQTQQRMSEALVSLFEQSNTFAEAKERVGFLEELDVWESSFADRIRAAAEKNSQIYGSWGVAQRVKRLATKWEQSSPQSAG